MLKNTEKYKITRKNRHQFLGRMLKNTEKYENYPENRHQFLGRMLKNTENYENYQEKSTSVLGPHVAQHWKVRELRTAKTAKKVVVLLWKPRWRASQNTEKYENYQEKWTSKKLKSQKSTRITTQNPFRTLSRAPQTYEKY